jgi:hypothetical protein
MKARSFIYNILLGVILIVNYGCFEESITDYPPPSITVQTGDSFLEGDTLLRMNDSVQIGFEATSRSNVNLTHLHTFLNMDGEITRIDSGFNAPLIKYNRWIKKSIAERETWSFYVRDRNGMQSDSVIFTIRRAEDAFFGPILRCNVQLGAQESTAFGGFLSFPSCGIHDFSSAANAQSDIWMLYFFDNQDGDMSTIASPGSNIPESIYDLSSWTVKNTTRFLQITEVDDEQFSEAENDSLILSKTFEFASGKRKAKKLTVGEFYSFVNTEGIKGIFRVKEISGESGGDSQLEIILQLP